MISMRIKINYKRDLFKGYNGLCESIFCAPFEDPIKFKEDDFENKRFDDLINNGSEYLEFTSITDCDYVIIPYKWDNRGLNSSLIINEAISLGKKVISLHNDDYAPQSSLLPNEGYLFTTTLNSKTRKVNEFSLPAFTGDFFNNNKNNVNRRVGFCGAITHPVRSQVLSILDGSSRINTDFIMRNSFWAHNEMTKDEARIGYMRNMIDNSFIVCMRGAGNFSYRLYETMMMGRIPIIIDNDQVFPFETIINYSEFSIKIHVDNINNLENILFDRISSLSDDDISKMQNRSREVWIEYFSPLGWIKNFHKEL